MNISNLEHAFRASFLLFRNSLGPALATVQVSSIFGSFELPALLVIRYTINEMDRVGSDSEAILDT
jgi:hypothetical protein